jgi:hypothetical protein
MMGASTLRACPLPRCKHAQSAWTRSGAANRACHGGKLGINFNVARTACGRFLRWHPPKLRVAGTGHTRAEPSCHTLTVVLAEMNLCILRHQQAGQLVVAILGSITNPLLDAGREFLVVAVLRLRQTPVRLARILADVRSPPPPRWSAGSENRDRCRLRPFRSTRSSSPPHR